MLAWSPSSDNVGVVEYGLYASGLRVANSSDASATLTSLACGTSYLVAIDAADAAGNRSAQATSYLRTSACPSSNQAPSTPTGLKVTAASTTSVSLAWTASKDDVAVSGYGLYVAGKRTTETTTTSADFAGLQCGTTYALGVDAFDAAGKRSTVTELSTATSPCASTPAPPPTTTGTVTQTIANGATLSGVGQLARHLRQKRRHGRGRPRLDRVLRRRHPGAVRDQPALRRHRRLLDLHHRQRRPTHLPGARPQRRRHRPRHQHHHRHRRQQVDAAADHDRHRHPDDRQRRHPLRRRSTGAPSTTKTATRSRTTPARSRSTSTAPRCCPRSTRPSATPPASGPPPPSTTANTPSRCAPSTTPAPSSPPTPSPPPSPTSRPPPPTTTGTRHPDDRQRRHPLRRRQLARHLRQNGDKAPDDPGSVRFLVDGKPC